MCHFLSTAGMQKKRVLAVSACLAAGFLASPAVLADETPNLLTDSFQMSLGTFVITSEPEVELNGKTLNGTKVDFDKVLGGGDSQRLRFDSSWRFADRHKAKFIAFAMNRDRTKTIDEEIIWDDVVYPINAKVKAEFSFSVVEAVYEYAFLKKDTYELDGSIGLHWTSLSSSLKATGSVQGSAKNEASVDLPLPVIGLRGMWKLPHDFYIDATAQFFALSIDQYDGSLQDYRVMAIWQPRKWVGMGLGYNQFNVDVDVDADKFNGSLNWKYNGPMAFYSVSF
jgi:hypothetical protein